MGAVRRDHPGGGRRGPHPPAGRPVPHARVLMATPPDRGGAARAERWWSAGANPGTPPKLVRREHLSLLKPHALMVDVAIDRAAASRPPTPPPTTTPCTRSDIRHYSWPSLQLRSVTAAQARAHHHAVRHAPRRRHRRRPGVRRRWPPGSPRVAADSTRRAWRRPSRTCPQQCERRRLGLHHARGAAPRTTTRRRRPPRGSVPCGGRCRCRGGAPTASTASPASRCRGGGLAPSTGPRRGQEVGQSAGRRRRCG
ncbi:hypothetical protein QJS66_16345 [Kocuria rhizophila]|nr:hypothetical protein QJS66_16345 [Kocuria rhizophila]